MSILDMYTPEKTAAKEAKSFLGPSESYKHLKFNLKAQCLEHELNKIGVLAYVFISRYGPVTYTVRAVGPQISGTNRHPIAEVYVDANWTVSKAMEQVLNELKCYSAPLYEASQIIEYCNELRSAYEENLYRNKERNET